jgi:hypothetical protein
MFIFLRSKLISRLNEIKHQHLSIPNIFLILQSLKSSLVLLFLYGFLYASSIVAINPWGGNPDPLGTNRAEIWTQPKILVLTLIVFLNCGSLLKHLWRRRTFLIFAWDWKILIGLWLLYLGSATISTSLSPFPVHSLWGQSVMGDGLIYWMLIAAFVISNSLILKINPQLFLSQVYGLLFGGLILSFSIFPQLIDWRIDYTATSSQISDLNPQLLVSSIWQEQMPIGFYTNRGHAAFVLAEIACLSFITTLQKWAKPFISSGICVISCVALFLTQNRTGNLAFLIAVVYLAIQIYCRSFRGVKVLGYIIAIAIINLLILFAQNIYKLFSDFSVKKVEYPDIFEILEDCFTGRLYLWMISFHGIVERPLWGWGFNGFGIAHLFVADWVNELSSYLPSHSLISQILSLNEFTFEYLGIDQVLYVGEVLSHKAHNLVLDTTLSVGIIGFICYCFLLGFCLWKLLKSPYWGCSSLVIAYLIFTITWFESAQFTHLPWWSLSLGFTSVPYHMSSQNGV